MKSEEAFVVVAVGIRSEWGGVGGTVGSKRGGGGGRRGGGGSCVAYESGAEPLLVEGIGVPGECRFAGDRGDARGETPRPSCTSLFPSLGVGEGGGGRAASRFVRFWWGVVAWWGSRPNGVVRCGEEEGRGGGEACAARLSDRGGETAVSFRGISSSSFACEGDGGRGGEGRGKFPSRLGDPFTSDANWVGRLPMEVSFGVFFRSKGDVAAGCVSASFSFFSFFNSILASWNGKG